MLWTLILIPVCVLGLGWVASQVNPAWSARYFAPVLAALLFLIAWGCARARLLGFVAIAVAVLYLHNPASFAPKNKSNVRQIAAQMSPYLHKGDLVIVGQPEETPLNWYYMPAGLRFTNTMGGGILADPRYVDWSDALARLKRTQPAPTLNKLVSGLRVGQQVMFVRPLTEGAQNWQASWTIWVRRRSAQWTAALADDVSRGILKPVHTAPDVYPGDCCVGNSAVLYRKVKAG
jgi:mannosyltransferase